MKCFVAFDTSCYTTSVAIMDENGFLLADCRRLLRVAQGKRGLAQSEMVFQHTRNIAELFEEAMKAVKAPLYIAGVGVSAKPRPLPESYMPAFLVGLSHAVVLGNVLGVPVYQTSHQEGHIYAGVWSSGNPAIDEFIALQFSGGTSEILRVQNFLVEPVIEQIGGSVDLNAGQFIDRVGVALGLGFPAGPKLEELAATCIGDVPTIPSVVRDLAISFSGPETGAQRLVAQGTSPPAVAAAVQACVARTVVKVLTNATVRDNIKDVLITGGVMSNAYIREYVVDKLARKGIKIYIPEAAYSADNAVGVAYIAKITAER